MSLTLADLCPTTEMSRAEAIARLPERARARVLRQTIEHLGGPERWRCTWPIWARPAQFPPPGDWLGWLIVTGRGWGKGRAAAETCLDLIRRNESRRSGFVARTSADVRDVLVEGDSGIMTVAPMDFRPRWEPSIRRLTWPNGAITTTYSADEPDVLRGPQHDLLYCDEIASWKSGKLAWDNAMLGLRIGAHPRWIATTTPRSVPLMQRLLSAAVPVAEYRKSPTPNAIVLTGGSTYDNLANLAPAFIDTIVRGYEGTRLGRQELYGHTLEDNPDALWTRQRLEDGRVTNPPQFRRIVVAVDPAATSTEESAETGIMVCGLGEDHHGYLLEDCSLRGQPHEWATAAVAAYHRHHANAIVAEVNQGGDMVLATIASVDGAESVMCHKVVASRGKYTRAEPIATLYEQGRVHHVGYFAELEDQLCVWSPGDTSPDRLDALVWGFTDLMIDLKRKIYGRDYGIAGIA